MTKAGSRAQIGTCGFLRKKITDQAENVEFRKGIDVSCVSNESRRVPTSSFAVAIQAVYGFEMSRMSKGLLSELLFGDIGVKIPTYVENDNSTAAYQVDSANAVANGKRLNGLLESDLRGISS